MKTIKKRLALFLLLFCNGFAFSQSTAMLKALPKTQEEFVASEKEVLATIEWLKTTPPAENEEMRKFQYAILTAWITNSPTVTIELRAEIPLALSKKNKDMLLLFMAGWTKYSLLNNYSKDVVQGNLAGIRMAIEVYKHGWMKKDKEVEKFIDMEKKGELEEWVTKKLS
jgi:hypothetical protein